MKFVWILFLLIASSILLGSHLLVYFSFVRFLAIEGAIAKKYLIISLGLLSISFIVASILAHWWESDLTRAIYFLAGTWLGFLCCFFFMGLFGYLLFWILPEKFEIAYGYLMIFISVLYVGYGLWGAQNPIINQAEVKIGNLPVSWQGKTIVQLSDVHMGLVNQPRFMEKLVARTNELNPAAVFITGDYFDGMDGKLDGLIKPINQLKAEKGVYFVTGNHETYLGLVQALGAIAKTKAKILNNEKIVVDGLTISGISYPPRDNFSMKPDDFVAQVKALNASRPNILLYHEPKPALVEAVADANVADLMLSGHTHNGQLWPFNYVTSLIYKQYTRGLNVLNDFSIYTSIGAGSWGPPIRTTGRPEIVAITLK